MMKRAIAVFGATILAAVLAVGGFRLGEWYQLKNRPQDETASPKQSRADIPPAESAKPEEQKPEANEREGDVDRVVTRLDTSAAGEGEWTRVYGESLPDNADSTVTLYTSAEKDDEGYLWNDSQKWVVELADSDGGYYTLYDQNVPNGRVYFDVAARENGDLIVMVYTLSATGISVNQYNRTDEGFTEKSVYNSGAVNRLFTSIPDYE